MNRRTASVLLSFALVIGVNPVHGQSGRKPDAKVQSPTFKLRVDRVIITATVTDSFYRPITVLRQENFTLLVDNRKRDIIKLSQGDSPLSACVLVDTSGSMSGKLGKAKEAAIEFFKTFNSQDDACLIDFKDERPWLESDFAPQKDAQSNLVYSVSGGKTPLRDAIYYGLHKLREKKAADEEERERIIKKGAGGEPEERKYVLLIISDGGDNRSRYLDEDIKYLVKESEILIYAIAVTDPAGLNATSEERNGPELLQKISDMTGGRFFWIKDDQDLKYLPDIAARIGDELRNQYTIFFRNPGESASPTRSGGKKSDGERIWHKIKLAVHPPKGLPPLEVRTKSGYWAPKE